jgi:hypothetical protein
MLLDYKNPILVLLLLLLISTVGNFTQPLPSLTLVLMAIQPRGYQPSRASRSVESVT